MFKKQKITNMNRAENNFHTVPTHHREHQAAAKTFPTPRRVPFSPLSQSHKRHGVLQLHNTNIQTSEQGILAGSRAHRMK